MAIFRLGICPLWHSSSLSFRMADGSLNISSIEDLCSLEIPSVGEVKEGIRVALVLLAILLTSSELSDEILLILLTVPKESRCSNPKLSTCTGISTYNRAYH